METYAAATAAANSNKLSLKIKDATLDWSEVEITKELLKDEGRLAHLDMPPGTTKVLTLFYRKINCVNKKIENALMCEVEEVLANMAEKITFINRTK